MHVAASILSVVLLASQAAQTLVWHQCEVSVEDKLGALVSGAHIHVYRDELFGSAFEKTFIADKNGTLHFPTVDGWYDICVMRGAFTPQCREIDVQGKDVSVKFTLAVSATMSKQLGDRAQ
jgi:hypothetical protein